MQRQHDGLVALAGVLALYLAAGPAFGDPGGGAGGATVTRASGGSIQTKLTSLSMNEGSSLQRQWIAIHDSAMPVDLVGTPGLETVYFKAEYHYRSCRQAGGEWWNRDPLRMTVAVPLAAVEVRFLVFDVWGDPVVTLATTEIRDFVAGPQDLACSLWYIPYEAECAEHYASIAYIARVRTQDGRVINASDAAIQAVLAEAAKFSSRVTPGVLEPRPDKGSVRAR